jgi:hypothetical protein
MTKPKHTPGNWLIEFQDYDPAHNEGPMWTVYVDSPRPDLSEKHIATMGIQGEEDKANARLIAAAPDLLAALRYFATLAHPANGETFDTETVGRMLGAARTAVARAEGRD